MPTHTESLSHSQIQLYRSTKLGRYSTLVFGKCSWRISVHRWFISFQESGEDPSRMFAGEGGPERTNKRFHYVSAELPAKRLSTAFDSVTLYGNDPHTRPDIYGKIGNAGVSICF
jgi:methylmalonyl-CoA mutase